MDHEYQLQLEELFNKNQQLPRLKREFNDPEIIAILEHNQIPKDFGISLLSHMCIHKRIGVGALVGILQHHFKESSNPYQDCADMLYEATRASLVMYEPTAEQFIIQIDLGSDIYREMALYQFPLPMVVEPQKVTQNHHSAYLSNAGNHSLILKEGKPQDYDLCLDHINTMNAVEFSVNLETASFVKNKWKGLDGLKVGESFQDFKKRKAAFAKYDQCSKEVMEHMAHNEFKFFVTNKYDRRGRTYSVGYHINPQGNEWNKAVLEFAQKEVVT